MKKMIQIEKKTCKGERTKKKVFKKIFEAPKKIAPHQTKMKSMKVRQKELYSWQ
jgi:hypothetical protein